MLHWVLSTSSVAARTPDWGNVWRRDRRPWRGARGVRTVSCLSQTAGSVVAASTAVIVRLSMTAGATLTLPSTVTVTVTLSWLRVKPGSSQ